MKYLHPLVILVYFIFVIGLAMIISNPICTIISLTGALALTTRLKGMHGIRKGIFALIPLILVTALINPLFSHQGITILAYFPNGNPLTLESILYGINMSAVFLSVILWFVSVNEIMSSERIMYVLGRIMPVLALTFSMILKFIPLIRKHIKETREVNRVLRGDSQNSMYDKIKEGISDLSSSLTWILDDSVMTADSMKCRGYGLPGRTSYTRYVFTKADAMWLIFLIVLMCALLFGYHMDYIYWQFYPYILGEYYGALSVLMYVVYVILCFVPSVIWERRVGHE